MSVSEHQIHKVIGQLDAQEPKMIVLNSRAKPGAFPTLCCGTNKTESLVLTRSSIGIEALLSSVLAGFSTFADRPPHVILLRNDWAELRGPRRVSGPGSEKDLDGTVCEGDWYPPSWSKSLSMVGCVDEGCSENVSSVAGGLAVYLTECFAASPDKGSVRIGAEWKRVGEQGFSKELIGESGSQGESERTHRGELGDLLGGDGTESKMGGLGKLDATAYYYWFKCGGAFRRGLTRGPAHRYEGTGAQGYCANASPCYSEKDSVPCISPPAFSLNQRLCHVTGHAKSPPTRSSRSGLSSWGFPLLESNHLIRSI